MNKTIIILSLIVLIQSLKAQTNVSGGIYSNTTWSVINSPYIVIDTVVVFPNVTLTIEPGVVVKFNNNKRLEIRQGHIIANGTINDTISFTSNSVNPSLGIWSDIYLNGCKSALFNYCKFNYATKALNHYNYGNYITVNVNNSVFTYNNFGIYHYNFTQKILVENCLFNFCNTGFAGQGGTQGRAELRNCILSNNQNGISYWEGAYIKECLIESNSILGLKIDNMDSVINCTIRYNAIGIYNNSQNSNYPNYIYGNIIEYNNIGLNHDPDFVIDNIVCNKICNNTLYDVNYLSTSYNSNLSNNYWCINDSVVISSHIYDGYDNINLGLVTFMPLDTSLCYLATGIKENVNNNISFNIFPNPASDKLTLILPMNNLQYRLKIYNLIGQLEFLPKIENINTELNILELKKGIYIIELFIDDKIYRKKFIKQ